MGLLSADLDRHRSGIGKVAFLTKASEPAIKRPTPSELLKICLEQYTGATQTLEKSATETDYRYLHDLHKAVEAAYRSAVKLGKRDEADKVVEKFAEWKYLKGQPGQEGDLHPFPVPNEK